jgi:hypothetical protein
MVKGPSLTEFERRIVKRLIADGERNQDVHVLVNTGRSPTVNFGRFSGSKDWEIEPASDEEVARFRFEKSLVDLRTGLSPLEDERLYKAREAMLLAVECFNNPLLHFKVEIFAVLSQIAWTYLVHEYYARKKVPITTDDGHTLALSQLWGRDDFPLKGDVKKNLEAVKLIRDDVEHRTLNAFGIHFYTLFQSNCLNFEEAIKQLFGERLSLGEKLSVALQFSQMSLDQLALLQKFDVSPAIEAIEQNVTETVGETGKEGIHYKFKVHFSLEGSAKGNANIQFTNDNTKSVSNVLAQKIALDELWPFKPKDVVDTVRNVNAVFNFHHHTLAWKKFAVRPAYGAANPANCNKKFCTYNKAHKDYTYSQEWIDLLSETAGDDDSFAELLAFKP